MRNYRAFRVWLVLALIWCAGVIFSPDFRIEAQTALRGQAKDFVTSARDDKGKTTAVLKGKTFKQLANGLVEIEGMLVETFRDERKYMTVEAPRCLYDLRSNIAFSSGELIVRTVEDQFSIRGEGFRWQQDDSRLVISNRVHTVIQKPSFSDQFSLEKPPTNKPPATPNAPKPGQTNALPLAGQTIEIDSDQFDYRSNIAIFRGHVRANDPEGNLTCGILKVIFEAAGGKAEKIEAEEEVVFEQNEIRASGQKAVYTLKDKVVTFTGNPSWKIGDKEGSGEVIVVDNIAKSFRVERRVSVKLLPDKMMTLDWLSPRTTTNALPQAIQPLTILADELNYRTNLAVFRGSVQISDARGGTLTCGILTNIFAGPEGKLVELVADQNVEFKQNATMARGDRAIYRVADQIVTLTGNPTWKIDQGEGKADVLIISTTNRTIRAERNVTMKLFNQTVSSLDLSFSKSQSSTNSQTQASRDIEISADELHFKSGSAIFLNSVRLSDAQNAERELTCEVLAAFFVDPDNKLDQIVAEEKVFIRQGGLQGSGNKVVYWVAKGFMELSGNPQVSTPSRKFKADKFIMDRANDTFRMKGNYRIELERGALNDATQFIRDK
jgi:lipopolysaccharide export system protein LptA